MTLLTLSPTAVHLDKLVVPCSASCLAIYWVSFCVLFASLFCFGVCCLISIGKRLDDMPKFCAIISCIIYHSIVANAPPDVFK